MMIDHQGLAAFASETPESHGENLASILAKKVEAIEKMAAEPVSRILSALRRDDHSSGTHIAARL
jgi:hypothetical protein